MHVNFRSAEHQRALWKLQEVSNTTETQGMSLFYAGYSTQLAFGTGGNNELCNFPGSCVAPENILLGKISRGYGFYQIQLYFFEYSCFVTALE